MNRAYLRARTRASRPRNLDHIVQPARPHTGHPATTDQLTALAAALLAETTGAETPRELLDERFGPATPGHHTPAARERFAPAADVAAETRTPVRPATAPPTARQIIAEPRTDA
ncbi:hypothetical protein [Actinoplanes sp. NBRC 101535]|uniref:hypothetical protein n=1 Tax=Actinoplanes sp. NBRC 101535 TaxID=3032196 RepID=UPI0024A3D711|nr:hypothetical protein [Actinoplanes sp. NBRC 101535]GLY08329.1 hypothetical protein Acsp01_87080 [Actinoplanes sp. NBRC 101535]